MVRKAKYTSPRRAIPESIKREIRIEAKFACIICQSIQYEFAHIDGDRNNHSTENLVALCPNHHKQFDDGKIPRKDILEFKAKARQENEEILQLKQQLDYVLGAKKISVSSDFGKLKLKYQNLLSDYGDKLIFYQCFIYLIPEFYLDARGNEVRAIVRALLELSPEEERAVLDHLIQMDIVEIVGDLVALRDNNDAKVALNQLIESGKLDIARVTAAFVGI